MVSISSVRGYAAPVRFGRKAPVQQDMQKQLEELSDKVRENEQIGYLSQIGAATALSTLGITEDQPLSFIFGVLLFGLTGYRALKSIFSNH